MRIDPANQLFVAAASLFLGSVSGFLYDFFRILRRRAGSRAFTALADILFCLVLGTGLFLLGFSLGGGSQRIFMSVLAFLGGVVYFCTLSSFSLVLCGALYDAAAFILRCAFQPFVWSYKILKKIVILIKNIFHYAKKWYTINWDKRIEPSRRKQNPKTHLEGNCYETQAGRYYY